MSRPRIGAVTIGQAPRPDLVEPLLERIGTDADVIEAGALDGLAAADLPSGSVDDLGAGAYPLTTRLGDGTLVTLDERELAPLVQGAIDRVEDAGADVTLLLCAGGFADARARRHLVRPFDAAATRVRDMGARRLGIVVPVAGQVAPGHRKWGHAGFEVTVLVGDPASVDLPADDALDALVLDYVGHPPRDVQALRERTSLPVLDLGECGADAAAGVIAERLGRTAVAGR